jgi:putative DNA primase/helicase
LWLAVNHKPRIKGTDPAIWRRTRLIPFVVTIPENERDLDLGEKLKKELPGILTWAVQGCHSWREQGLQVPEAVKRATEDYRDESDSLAAFLQECCEVRSGHEVSKTTLYEAYVEWAKRSGEYPVSKKELGSRLKEKGFLDGRMAKNRVWKDLNLVEVSEGMTNDTW